MDNHALAIVGLFAVAAASCDGTQDRHDPVTAPGIDNGAPAAISEGVTGRVRASGGAAIVGAMVQPRALEANARPIPEIAIVSDGEGRYVWRLFPGKYEISVSAEGYAPVTATVAVAGGQVTTQDFVLERAR